MERLGPASLTGALGFVLGVAIKIPIVCVVLEGGPGTLHVSAGQLGGGQGIASCCGWDH